MPPKKENITKALSRRQQTGRNVVQAAQAVIEERIRPALIRFEDQIRTEQGLVNTRQQLLTREYVQVGNQRRRITVEQKADMVQAMARSRDKIARIKQRQTDATSYFWKLKTHNGPPPPPPPGSVGFT